MEYVNEKSPDKTVLVRCDSYDAGAISAALDEALSLTNGLDWVRPGMRIVVKPNLLMRKAPEAACTTHPAILCALIERLVALDADVVVGDSPGGPFKMNLLRSIYAGTKMTEVESYGARLNANLDVAQVFNPEGEVLKKLDICQFILEADAVIDVAKLKTHGMMRYSGAVKNLFGVIPGTMKAEYHYRMPTPEAFAQMLVDLALYVKPRLSMIHGNCMDY